MGVPDRPLTTPTTSSSQNHRYIYQSRRKRIMRYGCGLDGSCSYARSPAKDGIFDKSKSYCPPTRLRCSSKGGAVMIWCNATYCFLSYRILSIIISAVKCRPIKRQYVTCHISRQPLVPVPYTLPTTTPYASAPLIRIASI